jgi:preprotein translocase subunit SecA
MRVLERRVLIATVDRLWREHLYEMDYLKEGIGLRAMGQRDPLVEYKDEGAQMFQAMTERIREESVQQIFAYCRQFELALEKASAAADGQTPGTSDGAGQAGAAAGSVEAEGAAAARAVERAQAREAAAESQSLARAASVMGTVGREARQTRLRYSSSEGESSEAAGSTGAQHSGGSNRAQRRAAAKKARKRR